MVLPLFKRTIVRWRGSLREVCEWDVTVVRVDASKGLEDENRPTLASIKLLC
jgi:hypothetical protein